jgi:hypothetical protein
VIGHGTSVANRAVDMAARVNPVVAILSVLLLIVAIAAGAWLGTRHTPIPSPDSISSPNTATAADSSNKAATPVERPTQKRSRVRPQARIRSAARGQTPINRGEAPAETVGEASAIAPADLAADATEAAATPLEAHSGPIVAAEDDYIYSREGAGVITPRLMSLGFVHRLVFGLRVRTSTIELVVSKTGTVERAKILSTPAHWEDTILLSRAKTFRFVPAYRNGSPVRYRFVMDVDTSP